MCPDPTPDPTPAPSPPPTPSDEPISPGTAAAISVVAVISFMVFVLVIKNLIKKTSNAQGNQPNPNEEMREEGDEAIRRAFEIIDDHERNLARRLGNVRR